MSWPACCKSMPGLLYLLVVANGRTEKVGTRLNAVAISSAKANRRKSASFSLELGFCNGSAAIAFELADPPSARSVIAEDNVGCRVLNQMTAQANTNRRVATIPLIRLERADFLVSDMSESAEPFAGNNFSSTTPMKR